MVTRPNCEMDEWRGPVQASPSSASGTDATLSITHNLALYTVYLPLNGNDGQPIAASRLNWARSEIVRYAGGCTVLPASDGLWVADGGQVYLDRVVPILVVAPAGPETEWFFRRLAAELAILLEQHEIFIHRTPVSVVEALSFSEIVTSGFALPYEQNKETVS